MLKNKIFKTNSKANRTPESLFVSYSQSHWTRVLLILLSPTPLNKSTSGNVSTFTQVLYSLSMDLYFKYFHALYIFLYTVLLILKLCFPFSLIELQGN